MERVHMKDVQKVHARLQRASLAISRMRAGENDPRLLQECLNDLVAAVEFLADAIERMKRER